MGRGRGTKGAFCEAKVEAEEQDVLKVILWHQLLPSDTFRLKVPVLRFNRPFKCVSECPTEFEPVTVDTRAAAPGGRHFTQSALEMSFPPPELRP